MVTMVLFTPARRIECKALFTAKMAGKQCTYSRNMCRLSNAFHTRLYVFVMHLPVGLNVVHIENHYGRINGVFVLKLAL